MKDAIREKIEKKRRELDAAMERQTEYEQILKLSKELDLCINEYILCE